MKSQVGINTPNPQGTFHIDGAKDNPATGTPTAAQQTNDVVITSSGNMGIGTTAPNPNASLDMSSSNKGVLVPRVNLTGRDDLTTVLFDTPAKMLAGKGMLVYNMITAGLSDNQVIADSFYSFDGTRWNRVAGEVSDSEGSKIYKAKYRGRNYTPYTKPTLIVPELNMEFRFAIYPDGFMRLQIRLLQPPSTSIIATLVGHWHGASHGGIVSTYTFTSGNYNAWRDVDGNWSNTWAYYYLVSTNEVRAGVNNPINFVSNLYGLCGLVPTNAVGSSGEQSEAYSLAAEVF